jgi:hypothetical protein
MIAFYCTFIVGVVLLFSGFVKTIDSGRFAGHVVRYRLIPRPLVRMACLAFICLESALGAALVLHVWPQWIVSISIVLFSGFAALTLWGAKSGRVEDCGCYGGLLALSPHQSALLDAAYVFILAAAWLFPAHNYRTGAWKFILTAMVLMVSFAVSTRSLKGALFDFSRLKKGRRWRTKWLKDSLNDLSKGSHFAVFLDKECSFCKRWVPFLNVINVQPELPRVTGIMSLNDREVEAFKNEHLIRFPIAHMDKYLTATMTGAFPTAVLIENSQITEKWVGEMPKSYLDSIKLFYESIWTQTDKKLNFSG